MIWFYPNATLIVSRCGWTNRDKVIVKTRPFVILKIFMWVPAFYEVTDIIYHHFKGSFRHLKLHRRNASKISFYNTKSCSHFLWLRGRPCGISTFLWLFLPARLKISMPKSCFIISWLLPLIKVALKLN